MAVIVGGLFFGRARFRELQSPHDERRDDAAAFVFCHLGPTRDLVPRPITPRADVA